MKYIVQFHLNPDVKSEAIEFFETRGPNRTPGVTFVSAWIGKNAEVAFVLVESESEEKLAEAGEAWAKFGTFEPTAVIDIQQY